MPQYWPGVVNQMTLADDMSVILLKEDISTCITVRTFLLKPAEVTVKQVQLRTIPIHLGTKSCPSYPLIELKEKLDMHSVTGSNAPLIVQCMYVATDVCK